MSKTESHLSAPLSRRGPSIIRSDYREDEVGPSFIYPHLQVISLMLTNLIHNTY